MYSKLFTYFILTIKAYTFKYKSKQNLTKPI